MVKCAEGCYYNAMNTLTLKLVRDERMRKCGKYTCASLQRDTCGEERQIHQQNVTGNWKPCTTIIYKVYLHSSHQISPINLDESLWTKMSTLFSKYPSWTKALVSLASLLEMQNLKFHSRPTGSESEFYQHSHMIPMHIKSWEALESLEWKFLVHPNQRHSSNPQDETVLDVAWITCSLKIFWEAADFRRTIWNTAGSQKQTLERWGRCVQSGFQRTRVVSSPQNLSSYLLTSTSRWLGSEINIFIKARGKAKPCQNLEAHCIS